MFLATTGMTDFWDYRDELILLGRWCLRPDTEAEWRKLSYRLLPSPWYNPDTLKTGKKYCLALQNTALNIFAQTLNSIHGTSWSLRYWEIILRPWFIYFSSAIVDRRTCLAMALEEYPDAVTIAMDSESFITPGDTYDYWARSVDDPYNLQLFSQLLELSGHSSPTKSLRQDGGGGIEELSARTLRHSVKSAIKKISPYLNKLAGVMAPAFLYQGYTPLPRQLEIYIRSKFRIFPLVTVEVNTRKLPETNQALRRDLEKAVALHATELVSATDLRLMARNLPRIYLEGYHKARRLARNAFPARPKSLVSAVAWLFNEPFKFHAAECAEKGTRLVGIQHGGMYGYAADIWSEDHELNILDRFATWGWTDSGETARPCGCSPLASVSKAKSASTGKHTLLHVSTIGPRYLELFYNQPLGPGCWDYLQNQFTLLNALPRKIASNTLVRPYPQEYGWDHIRLFKEKCPHVMIDDFSESFTQRLLQARLVVCGDIQSTFLEALSYDIPTVAYIDPEVWKVRPAASASFQALHQAGIITYSPEEAVQRICRVFNNPEPWWRSEETRFVLSSFLETYCRTNEDWHACLNQCVFD